MVGTTGLVSAVEIRCAAAFFDLMEARFRITFTESMFPLGGADVNRAAGK